MKKLMLSAVLGCATVLAATTVLAQNYSDSDKKFLAEASQGNVVEVETAKLALKKSTNPEVKQFARKIIHDHQMLATKMAPFVKGAGLTPSTKLDDEHQSLYDKLNGYSGAEFDKEYIKAMDSDHHDDLDKFNSEIGSTQNPALKKAVTQGQKVIAGHTAMVDAFSKKING